MSKWIAVLGALVLGFGLGANGCTPIPREVQQDKAAPEASTAVLLTVEVEDYTSDSRLQIPRKLIGAMRAAAEAEGGKEDRAVAGGSRLHTIIAGVALSLALALSGLWFVRHRVRFRGQRFTVLLTATSLLVVGGALWADVAGPGWRPRRDRFLGPPALPPASGRVVVEIVDKGDTVKLIVN